VIVDEGKPRYVVASGVGLSADCVPLFGPSREPATGARRLPRCLLRDGYEPQTRRREY
jgi:hypothetical protein